MRYRRILSLLLALILCLTLACSAAAVSPSTLDFGDYAGGDDYGGDYDYDYDTDYDYDYGSDSDGSGSTGSATITFIAIVVVMLIVFNLPSRKKKKGSSSRKASGGQSAVDTSELESIESFLVEDPNFDEAEFTSQVSKLYIQLQNAWCARDLTPLRPYLTSALMGQSQSQIDGYISRKQTPHTERIAVLGVELLGWRRDKVNDTIYCRVRTRIVDYVTDDRSGEVVSGSKDDCKFMEYEWTMIRSIDRKTEKKDGVTAACCPSCGAPIDLNQSAVCPYCGTVAESTSYGWTLSGIKGISQRTE